MAQVNHIFHRRALFNRGRRDVGTAWTGCSSYPAWLGHTGDRVSMGEKVAGNSSSMAARPFSKSQVEKAQVSRSVDAAEVTYKILLQILQVFGVNCARS